MSSPPTPPRVLVVDSDDDLREAVSELLRERGFEVVEAGAGGDAFGILARRDVQAVVTNLRVRADDPATFIAALCAAAAPAPVGLITSWPISPAEAAARGLAFVLPQPFDAEVLLQRLAEHVVQDAVSARHIRLIEAYFAALGERDWNGLASLCTEDVEYHLPGGDPKFSRTVRGRAAFRDFSRQTFQDFPDARFRVQAVLPLPTGAVARYAASWATPSGERSELPGAVIFRIRESQIAEIGVRLETERLGGVS